MNAHHGPMTNTNAHGVDAKLRETFQVQHDYSEISGEVTWPPLIRGIDEVTRQVVRVQLDTLDGALAERAARAIMSLTGGDLPGLLGIQIIGPTGDELARCHRGDIMLLNVPLGSGRPDGW